MIVDEGEARINYHLIEIEARFKRRILHAPNAIQTMHNEEAYLIIYCLNCIRCMQNSTFETGLRASNLIVLVESMIKHEIFKEISRKTIASLLAI